MMQCKFSLPSDERSHEALIRHHCFDPEEYYQLLDDAQSISFYPITQETAKSLINFHRFRYFNNSIKMTVDDVTRIDSYEDELSDLFADDGSYFVRLSNRSPKDGNPLNINQAVTDCLRLLAACRVTLEEIEEYDGFHSRMVTLDEEEVKIISTDEKMKMMRSTPTRIQLNTILTSLYDIIQSYTSVKSSREVVSLLTSSSRVYTDLLRALGPFEESDEVLTAQPDVGRVVDGNWKISTWRQNLMFRKWDSRIDGKLEFRCFVWNMTSSSSYETHSIMTAISQYNSYILVDGLEERETRIAKLIASSWNDNHRLAINHYLVQYLDLIQVKIASNNNNDDDDGSKQNGGGDGRYWGYVVDYAVHLTEDDADSDVAILIELNPFEHTTGPGLFDWNSDDYLLMPLLDPSSSSSSSLHVPELRFVRQYMPVPNYTTGIYSLITGWMIDMKRYLDHHNGNDNNDDGGYWKGDYDASMAEAKQVLGMNDDLLKSVIPDCVVS